MCCHYRPLCDLSRVERDDGIKCSNERGGLQRHDAANVIKGLVELIVRGALSEAAVCGERQSDRRDRPRSKRASRKEKDRAEGYGQRGNMWRNDRNKRCRMRKEKSWEVFVQWIINEISEFRVGTENTCNPQVHMFIIMVDSFSHDSTDHRFLNLINRWKMLTHY